MAVSLVNVKIARLIVHEIFNHDPHSPRRPPSLSMHCTAVTGKARGTFLERLSKALGTGSSCVEMTISKDDADSVFQLSLDLLGATEDEEFAEISGTIATLLNAAQSSASIPGGIVIVFSGTMDVDDRPFVSIIKAEIQEGFRKKVEVAGGTGLELITDLFLTPQQKLYKIGLFVSKKLVDTEPTSPSDFDVYVYDSNISHNESAHAAKYFAEAFLGCVVPQTSKHLTKKFFDCTKSFIDDYSGFDDARRVDLKGALYTYLKVGTNKTISLTDFSDNYLHAKERQNYSQHMKGKGFPATSVHKDIELIGSQLKKVKITFTSGVQISAPGTDFNKNIKVLDSKEKSTIVEVQGRLISRAA